MLTVRSDNCSNIYISTEIRKFWNYIKTISRYNYEEINILICKHEKKNNIPNGFMSKRGNKIMFISGYCIARQFSIQLVFLKIAILNVIESCAPMAFSVSQHLVLCHSLLQFIVYCQRETFQSNVPSEFYCRIHSSHKNGFFIGSSFVLRVFIKCLNRTMSEFETRHYKLVLSFL